MPRDHADNPRFHATKHWEERRKSRGLDDPELVRFILTYGEEFDTLDARSYTVVQKSLPADMARHPYARRSDGWVVVVSTAGDLLTCYRRRDAVNFLRRKTQDNGRRATTKRRIG